MTESSLKSFREKFHKHCEMFFGMPPDFEKVVISDLDLAVEALKTRNQESGKFLQWIYDRLEIMYAENPNFDYMLKFKQIIDSLLEGEIKMSEPGWICPFCQAVLPDSEVYRIHLSWHDQAEKK